jgi:hypothetical protein
LNSDIITSEEAEEVVNAMPVNRSIRAISINIRCFLFYYTSIGYYLYKIFCCFTFFNLSIPFWLKLYVMLNSNQKIWKQKA